MHRLVGEGVGAAQPVTLLVAAGSNVDPERNLRTAIDLLAVRYPGLRCSRAWRNAAVGFAGEDFVNLALAFTTTDDVHEVIRHLQAAEAACGRARNAPKWAPRSMDLDILLYGDTVLEEPGLTLPRPDLVRRPYMLKPAAELEPQLRHPTDGRTLAELWAAFDPAAHPMQEVDLVLRCCDPRLPR
jgi:2-amino-4-hydroxy-6-hydroxymethyldihydropteridine diphosphokinase